MRYEVIRIRVFDYEYQVNQQPLLLPDAAVQMVCRDIPSGDAGLDEAGFYHAGVLRKQVRQWDFSYKVLSGRDYRYLLALFAGSGSFGFRFRGVSGQPEETLCYCEGIRSELFDRVQDIYKNVSFSVKEC